MGVLIVGVGGTALGVMGELERPTRGLGLGERWSCADGEGGSWDGRQFLC